MTGNQAAGGMASNGTGAGALTGGYMSLVYYSLFNGFVGVFIKMAHGLDILSIVFFRALIAAVFVGLVCLALRQGAALRPRHLRATLLVGALQGVMIALIMGAMQLTTVSNALFLLYTAPVFTVLLARTFLKERISPTTWAGIGVAMLGIVLIVDPAGLSLASADTLGNLMALGAGLALAAMTVAAKPLTRKVSGFYIVFWQYLVIALLALPFVRPGTLDTALSNWWQLGGLGVICTGVAFLWYMRGVRSVPAQHVLVVASLEPLVGTLIAGLILHEALSYLTAAGALCIMAGAYGVARSRTAGGPAVSEPRQRAERAALSTAAAG